MASFSCHPAVKFGSLQQLATDGGLNVIYGIYQVNESVFPTVFLGALGLPGRGDRAEQMHSLPGCCLYFSQSISAFNWELLSKTRFVIFFFLSKGRKKGEKKRERVKTPGSQSTPSSYRWKKSKAYRGEVAQWPSLSKVLGLAPQPPASWTVSLSFILCISSSGCNNNVCVLGFFFAFFFFLWAQCLWL